MINNGMSWLSLGNYINPKARNTELSNDYNQLTNRPIITLTGTSQSPIKLWKLDVGLYILNGYIQHTDALLSEARGLFVSATVGIVDGKYVISAFIPFWEGQYEYILPSLNSETYTEHQMIRMITQGNSLTLDNIREYFPTQDYHPTTKKYVDETMDAIRNELNKMGLNNNDVQSLIKENRRRDIAIQALLSQNSDKMVTINEEVHDISMDYSLDNGIATINTLEGDTLVNVSKNTEYDKILSYGQDIVENTNTVDLEADGNVNPIIVGDTLVNVCTQNNPTAITNEYTVEGNNHFALQDEVEGNCRPIIQGNTIVNYCTNGSEELTLNNEINTQGTNVTLTDTVDNGKVDVVCEGNTLVNILKYKDIQWASDKWNDYIQKHQLIKDLKTNTEYTIVVDVSNWSYDKDIKLCCDDTNPTTYFKGDSIPINGNGRYIAKRTTKADFSTLNIYNILYTVHNPDTINGACNVDMMIFEGDYTNKPIPSYFEGMKSVGECEDNKIEILLQNKNLLPLSHVSTDSEGYGDKQHSNWDNVRLKPNTKYTLSYTGKATNYTNDHMWGICVIEQKTGKLITNSHIIESEVTDISLSFTTTNEEYYKIQLAPNNGDNTGSYLFKPNTVILEEGEKTSYVPYTLNKKEISLNEPLRGVPDGVCDKFVKQGGKWYVERNCGQVTLDGSENWSINSKNTIYYSKKVNNSKIPTLNNSSGYIPFLCNNLISTFIDDFYNTGDSSCIGISNSGQFGIGSAKFSSSEELKQWLSQNPTTVVYQLATPTYEKITDSQLITYLDTTHISNNSTILCNMQVKNSGYNAIIKPSTQYTVALNANINEEINVDLGGTEVTTTNNVITITTPNTLTNENLMLYGKNVVINNAMLFEGDITSNLPSEYIEGLKSSFEDGYIPSENLLNSYLVMKYSNNTYAYQISVKPYTDYTLFFPYLITDNCTNIYAVYKGGDSALVPYTTNVSISPIKFNSKECTSLSILGRLRRNDGTLPIKDDSESLDDNWNKGLALFEGDWTHLHLTEEDFNHLGQYKVEYKVTGKNKVNTIDSLKEWDGAKIHFKNAQIDFIPRSNNSLALEYENPLNYNLKKGVTYTLSTKQLSGGAFSTGTMGVGIRINYTDGTDSLINIDNTIWDYNDIKSITFTTKIDKEIRKVVLRAIGYNVNNATANVYSYALQLEEGTVATEYEPYKESIQTVYLNSPLLEGDTIEEIDGEVYHVHRCGKVVLDGSENWSYNYGGLTSETRPNTIHFHTDCIDGKAIWTANIYCDRFLFGDIFDCDIVGINTTSQVRSLRISHTSKTLDDFKQWLSENPTTVVYELRNPTYELIPSSSIVCKSYPNGHLDFDTNVHIDNTVNFVKANLPITYANTSTNYKLQFVSDKDMENVTINVLGNIMENVTITKGLNKISFTSPSDATNILTFEGIGYAYISDVQLVATEKDIDYFKGLYSTYECGLIEDESNENYGKYEVNIVSYNAPIQFGKGGKIE